jgi:DNA-binding NarL/FixJ family response regulator
MSPERRPELERWATELGATIRRHLNAPGSEPKAAYWEIAGGDRLVRIMRLCGSLAGFVVMVEPLRRRRASAEAAMLYRLSARESEVLECLLRGMSGADVADTLRISETTVQSHIRNIGLKMHCSRRAEIVARAIGASREEFAH